MEIKIIKINLKIINDIYIQKIYIINSNKKINVFE